MKTKIVSSFRCKTSSNKDWGNTFIKLTSVLTLVPENLKLRDKSFNDIVIHLIIKLDLNLKLKAQFMSSFWHRTMFNLLNFLSNLIFYLVKPFPVYTEW